MWFWFIVFVALRFAIIYAIKRYIYGNDDYWPKQGVPFVGSNVAGSLWTRIRFKIPLHEIDSAYYKKFKSIDKNLKLGGVMEIRRPVAFLMDLDLIRLVMVKDFNHFLNRREFGRKDDPTLVHKMLFAMSNAEWKNMRSALSPTFTKGKIRRMFQVFNESSNKMSNFLKDEMKIEKQDEIDMRDVWGRYAMDVIALAAFGVDSQNFKDKNSAFAQMGHKFQAHFSGLAGRFRIFSSIFLPSVAKSFKLTFLDPVSVGFFIDVVKRTIKHRESTAERRNDFLQLVIDAKHGGLNSDSADGDADTLNISEKDSQLLESSGQKLSNIEWTDEVIAAQAVMFIFAGFESVESLLIFAAYELALNPEVQSRLFEEIDEVFQKHGELNYDSVNRMEYLDMVISETLRKHPPTGRTERKCTKDYKLPGIDVEIKAETVVVIPVHSIHHDPDIYPEPTRFLPERFSAEEKAKRHPYAYLPFGVGPRNCIAMRFALIEGKTAVAHLIHNFILKPSARTTIPMKYVVSTSLKPIDGMWLSVTPRS